MQPQNQTLPPHPLFPFAGCFQEQTAGTPFPYTKPYSDAADCAKFCLQPGPDDPSFMILYHALDPHCACSSRCTLSQVGNTLQRVADKLCSTACPDNSSLLCGGYDLEHAYFSVYSLKSDSGSCSETAMITPMNLPVLIVSFVAIGFTACILCALLYFIISEAHETPPLAVIFGKELMISPFNLQLSLMAMSLLGFYSCIIYESWLFVATTAYVVPMNFFFSATFKTVYLFHSWMRASKVINSVSILSAGCIRICLYTVPVVTYATMIPASCFLVTLRNPGDGFTALARTSKQWMRFIETASIILVATVDLTLLICFVLHILKNTRESEHAPIEQKFMVISYFGVVANALCFTALVVQIEQVATVVVTSRIPVHQAIVDTATHAVFTAVLLTLVLMKAAVRHLDRREVTTRRMTLQRNVLKHGLFTATVEDDK
ncbi:hypothetical protein HDU81_000307 [Chytriomyces hyalinus]|nr:hypothetical protein HDU81_000307 [Chytriomyces hyalinus]